MLIDTRVIARQSEAPGALQVLAEQQTILFIDGSTAALHLVQHHQCLALTTRAVLLADRLLLLDLARLVPGLEADLRASPARDVPGVVLYTLRRHYLTAPQFHAAALRKACGTWWPMACSGTSWRWCAAPRDVAQLQRQRAAAEVAPC